MFRSRGHSERELDHSTYDPLSQEDGAKQTDATVSTSATADNTSTILVKVLDVMNLINLFQYEILIDDRTDHTTSRCKRSNNTVFNFLSNRRMESVLQKVSIAS